MVEDYTKTARNSSVKQIRGSVLLDDNGVQTGISGNPLHVQGDLGFLELTDLEGVGDVGIGTSEVEIVVSGTPTQAIRIQADVDNTGIIFIGKTGVLNDKTNDFVRLFAGDEAILSYNDATNALFAISDTAAQTINVGALL